VLFYTTGPNFILREGGLGCGNEVPWRMREVASSGPPASLLQKLELVQHMRQGYKGYLIVRSLKSCFLFLSRTLPQNFCLIIDKLL